jgi:hypothetical protein
MTQFYFNLMNYLPAATATSKNAYDTKLTSTITTQNEQKKMNLLLRLRGMKRFITAMICSCSDTNTQLAAIPDTNTQLAATPDTNTQLAPFPDTNTQLAATPDTNTQLPVAEIVALNALIVTMNDKIDGLTKDMNEKIDGLTKDMNEKIDGLTKDMNEKIDGLKKTSVV